MAAAIRWFWERLGDNFRSVSAARAWLWSYVPIVGGASAWPSLVFLMVMHFVVSCLEQFAQSQVRYCTQYAMNMHRRDVLNNCYGTVACRTAFYYDRSGLLPCRLDSLVPSGKSVLKVCPLLVCN